MKKQKKIDKILRMEIEKKEMIHERLLETEKELDKVYNSKRWKFISPSADTYAITREKIKKILARILPESITSKLKISIPKEYINCNETQFKIIPKETGNYKKIEFKKASKPLVTIIIPVYNQWKYTHSCLRSIFENTKDISYEIIIADDKSKDDTKKIRKYVKNVIVIRNKKNLGFLKNCNAAAKKAKGKYLLFLNNDTNVQKNWLTTMIDLIESDANIGLVGSKLVYPDGRLQEAGGIIWKDTSAWNYGKFQDPNLPEFNYVKETDYVSGACLLILQRLWKEIGGFDVAYAPAFYEDADIAFEVRKKGYKVMYQPKSVIVHFEGISCGKDESRSIKKYQVVNKKKFYQKWRAILEKEHFSKGENVFLARDRSKGKKVIVFIDSYVPHYDKDCGSRSIWQCMTYFFRKGYNVKFIGDNFFPHQPYTEELEQLGIEVLYGSKYKSNWQNWVLENKNNIDIFYLYRPHVAIKYIDFIKERTKCRLYYQGVDLHYLREKRRYEIEHSESALKSSKYLKELEYDIMKKADCNFFFSDEEVNIINKEAPNLNVKKIPLYVFNKEYRFEYKAKNRHNIYFIGSFLHSPNSDGLKWFLKEVYPLVIKEIPHLKLFIIGKNPPNELFKYHSSNIIFTGYLSDQELDKLQKKIRLEIAPLRYGAGIKGKIIEAMWKGIPVVTTTIGAEGIKFKELAIADSEQEFANQVVKMYNSKKLNDLSKKEKEFIEQNYSEKAFEKAIGMAINND